MRTVLIIHWIAIALALTAPAATFNTRNVQVRANDNAIVYPPPGQAIQGLNVTDLIGSVGSLSGGTFIAPTLLNPTLSGIIPAGTIGANNLTISNQLVWPNGIGISRGAVRIKSDGTQISYSHATNAFDALQNNEHLLVWGTHTVIPVLTGSTESAPAKSPLQIVNRTNVVIRGMPNAEFYGEGRGDFLTIQNSTDIRVDGLTFRGNKPAVVWNEGELFSMIILRRTNSWVTIENCRFIGYGDHAVTHLWNPQASSRVTVYNCYFENGGDPTAGPDGDGAAIAYGGMFWKVINNHFTNVFRGVEIQGSTAGYPAQHSIISGNTFHGLSGAAICLFGTGNGEYSDHTVAGNVMRQVGLGVLIAGGHRISVIGNVMTNVIYHGIWLGSDDKPLRDSLIADNIVHWTGWSGIQVHQAGANDLSNVMIQDNIVYRSNLSGILAKGTNITIRGNHVIDGSTINADGASIKLLTHSPGAIIADNRLWSDRTTFLPPYGIRIESGVTNALLRANWINNTSNAVLNAGTGTITQDWGAVSVLSGAGSPEGAVTAPIGSLYTRTDGGAGTTLYVKESGTGNTGWAAK